MGKESEYKIFLVVYCYVINYSEIQQLTTANVCRLTVSVVLGSGSGRAA